MAHACPVPVADPRCGEGISADWPEAERWRVGDGVLFSILSSMVLWSILFTSIYQALS